jgi:hypothetical protein
MVGKDLYYPTFRDAALPASFQHQFQLGPERGQTPYSLLSIRQARTRDDVSARAGLVWLILQRQKVSDGLKIKSEFPSMPYERNTAQIGLGIQPPISTGTGRRREKPDLLIIADGRNLDATLLGHLADRQSDQHFACSSSHWRM